MIKLTLSKYISSEQFGFLEQRQIHGVVAITQECIHSIKSRQIEACLMRIDLINAYDCVDWEFLMLILRKIGFWCTNGPLDYGMCLDCELCHHHKWPSDRL